MKQKLSIILTLALSAGTFYSYAGENEGTTEKADQPTHSSINTQQKSRFYTSTAMEGNILSTSILEKGGTSDGLTTPRFTAFFHMGVNVHHDFSNKMGIITGLGIRNIGFIEKLTMVDSTVKRRIYGLTVPALVKFGNMSNRTFFFAGAELTMAFNYKEKGFVKRNNKDKFNEWFSRRTPLFHPSIAAGYQMKYGYIKMNYYINNFLNTAYVDKNSLKPYEGYNVNLITLTFGMSLPHKSSFYDFDL